MKIRRMVPADLPQAVSLYIDYYNNHEGEGWTEKTTTKRIHQVLTREDSLCMVIEDDSQMFGFAMGYLEQYSDLASYDLIEIVIRSDVQRQGLGSMFMRELEQEARNQGAAMIQLQAVNDDAHHRFYGRLGYGDTNSLVTKTKWL